MAYTTHKIEVKEVLVRIVPIKAHSTKEAIDKARQMYHNEEIVLSESDFDGNTSFEVQRTEKR